MVKYMLIFENINWAKEEDQWNLHCYPMKINMANIGVLPVSISPCLFLLRVLQDAQFNFNFAF